MVFNNRGIRLIMTLLSCVLLNSCQNRIFENTVAIDAAKDFYSVDLSYLPFNWDNAYFFQGDYSDNEIETIIKAKLLESTDIAYFVAVFIADGKVVHEECWYHQHSYKHYIGVSIDYKGYYSLSINNPCITVKPIKKEQGVWYEIVTPI